MAFPIRFGFDSKAIDADFVSHVFLLIYDDNGLSTAHLPLNGTAADENQQR